MRGSPPNWSSARRRALAGLQRWGILTGVIVGLLFIFLGPVFRIKNTICRRQSGECLPRHLEILNLQKGKLSLFVKPRELATQLEQDPSIRSAKVSVGFPNTLKADLEVETRLLPLGFINIDRSELDKAPESSTAASPILKEILLTSTVPSGWYDLTGEGVLLQAGSTNSFALVLGQEAPKTEQLVSFYQLWLLLESEGLGWKKLWLSGNHAGVELTGGANVIIDLFAPLEQSLTTLQQILSTTTIDLSSAVLDLRFKNPVVYKSVN